MRKSVIFDMDGTLFQTNKILELSLEDTFNYLKSLGKWDGHTPIEKYREIMGVPLPEVWETLLPNHTMKIREEVNQYFLETLVENIHRGKGALYPHVESILTHLKENDYSLFIASNGLTTYLEAIVTQYHLDRWVSEVFSIEQIQTLNKSDLVKRIIDKYDVKAGAVVGDRLSDIKAAKENGLISIGCRFDFAKEEELSQADFVVNDLMELENLLIKK
ncbi:HAD hydrolase-like protein [Bacillus carboniphilus]|uniref:HAD hydrolase-like protein n=1 Tax=Bacillus carboniphilus TaxID=86663 RepID=A0ABY9JQY7_9BACI|nr:HAD hydrolase-like protein [Bacillus carboniphilus]WLR41801.1 HAD hydrolase-like protein [Bacillus carboniphilus]